MPESWIGNRNRVNDRVFREMPGWWPREPGLWRQGEVNREVKRPGEGTLKTKCRFHQAGSY